MALIKTKKQIFFFRLVMLACVIFNSQIGIGQDMHFSQYNSSALNLNPAFTGFFDGDYRLNGIYRSQWASVPVPYQTFSFAADGKVKVKKIKRDRVGVGMLFNNDKAGDTYYGTNQFYASGSYIHALRDSTLLWSAGITAGISSVGFNYGKMTFDDQYQISSYSATNPTGENFAKNTMSYGDVNIGTAIQLALKQRAFIQYGISCHHVTGPKLSFQNNKNTRMDPKLNNYVCFAYPLATSTDIIIELLHTHQGKYNELVPGMQFKIYIDDRTHQAASMGIYYRAKDAAIARVGYQFKTVTAGFSYDVNTSKFVAATTHKGGFELFLTYIFKKAMPFAPKTRICPVYM